MRAATGLARRARRRLDDHRPAPHLARVEAFAVDDRSVQVVWGRAPAGPVHVTTGRRGLMAVGDDGPGGVVIDGLPSDTLHRIGVESARSEHRRLRVHTLAPPPGALLCRVATVNDLHVGAMDFGLLRSMVDRSGLPEPAAQRCARRALQDAAAWGAQLLVVKGDVTNQGWHGQWAALRGLLGRTGLPAVVVAGNHDVSARREIDLGSALLGRPVARGEGAGPAGAGAAMSAAGTDAATSTARDADPRTPSAKVAVAAPLHVTDLPGIRVVTVDSSRDTRSTGSLRPVLTDLLDALAEADRPALVCVHHCLDRWPVPTKYPRGITWPESPRVLGAIRRVKADVVITTGHSHRNRVRRVGPIVVSEVASTKDYPGVWAGYAVHEGGIVQVVRRMTWPDAMGWTEYSRRAVGGLWRWYAPGRLADRCFSHRWPPPGSH